MAAIISIRSHPHWGERRASAADTDAAIIIFPGVRYERPEDDDCEENEPQASAKDKRRGGERRKTRA